MSIYKLERTSTEILFAFSLNVKKISGSIFSLKVSNIIVTKIRSTVFERLIFYLGKDFNRLHRDATAYPPYCISKPNSDTLH